MEVLQSNNTTMQTDNQPIKKRDDSSVIVQLHSEAGEATGPPLDVPLTITSKQLQLICNSFLENVSLCLFAVLKLA